MTQSKYEELYHHGIKGQKWGVRRFQNEDGTRTAAGKAREREADDYKSHKTKRLEKTASKIQKDIDSYEPIRGKDLTTKKGKLIATKDDIEVWRNASVEQKNKIDERLKKSKDSDMKNANAVKDYTKKYNKAIDAADKADEEWDNVKKQYKSLAKTSVGRMIQVSKAQMGKGSEAANKYLSMWDKAEKDSNTADNLWTEARSAYKQTGSNYVERIFNNIKYDKN